jgi:hypothetical protein
LFPLLGQLDFEQMPRKLLAMQQYGISISSLYQSLGQK